MTDLLLAGLLVALILRMLQAARQHTELTTLVDRFAEMVSDLLGKDTP